MLQWISAENRQIDKARTILFVCFEARHIKPFHFNAGFEWQQSFTAFIDELRNVSVRSFDLMKTIQILLQKN